MTGLAFRAFAAPADGTSAVCRHYLPARFGDSHFYGRDAIECQATASVERLTCGNLEAAA